MEEINQTLTAPDDVAVNGEEIEDGDVDTQETADAQESPEGSEHAREENESAPLDFEALAAADLAQIKALVPELADARHLSELPFAHRFAELRELGLSVKEALYATMPSVPRGSGKSHLISSVPRGRGIPSDTLSIDEMRAAKDLFYGLSEKEITSLYRRVRSV